MKQNLSKTCYQFFSTLANPTRLAIVELLSDGPKNVTEISRSLGQEQSMISHNLKPLERCRFVFSERRKREHVYYLNKETLGNLFKIFSYHAEKYCPTEGKCLTAKDLRELKKEDASAAFYLNRH
ncbi:MAG: winged helix-turn-helix transcriptional regulator [Candidatus Bathyarchaeota archaeon]|nr:MAG: winged helix-turn-helix transcriptional regulator [Candidatus Bathyarchaeota archaeon]